MEIEECCDNASDERLHLTMVSSGMASMAWVSVPFNPSTYISDMINSLPVYGDKILRGGEGKSPDEAERDALFVELFREMLKGLNEYVRTYHPKVNTPDTDEATFLKRNPAARCFVLVCSLVLSVQRARPRDCRGTWKGGTWQRR